MLYNVHSKSENKFLVNKFDEELSFENSYSIIKSRGKFFCSCPRGNYPVCKHKSILKEFQKKDRINTYWFYDLENDKWSKPIKYV